MNDSDLLDYSAARRHIKSGDVLLFEAGDDLWSQIIQWRTGSPFTHCGVAWRSLGRLFVVEALISPGVTVQPLSRRIERGARVHWHALVDTIDRSAVVGHALAQWGRPYSSLWQFVHSFVVPGWLRRGEADLAADRWFCSELVLSSLENGGYRSFMPPAVTTPGDLASLDCLRPRGVLQKPIFHALP